VTKRSLFQPFEGTSFQNNDVESICRFCLALFLNKSSHHCFHRYFVDPFGADNRHSAGGHTRRMVCPPPLVTVESGTYSILLWTWLIFIIVFYLWTFMVRAITLTLRQALSWGNRYYCWYPTSYHCQK